MPRAIEGTPPITFRTFCRLEYLIHSPITLLFNLRARNSDSQKVLSENFQVNSPEPVTLITSEPEKNRFDRLQLTQDQTLHVYYEATVQVQHHFFQLESLRENRSPTLGAAELPFLLPSRYCQSDLLGRFAWQKFGSIPDTYDQAIAVAQWIFENIEYVPGTTTSATSAYDSVTQCAGVCRDFAHLGIALCRALNIPARYVAGYAFQLIPEDFHACFEAFINGKWILFDATRLAPLNGLISIGVGRDAADVSVCTAFGAAQLVSQTVTCEALSPDYVPFEIKKMSSVAVSIDT